MNYILLLRLNQAASKNQEDTNKKKGIELHQELIAAIHNW